MQNPPQGEDNQDTRETSQATMPRQLLPLIRSEIPPHPHPMSISSHPQALHGNPVEDVDSSRFYPASQVNWRK